MRTKQGKTCVWPGVRQRVVAVMIRALESDGTAQDGVQGRHNPIAWVLVKVSSASHCVALEE